MVDTYLLTMRCPVYLYIGSGGAGCDCRCSPDSERVGCATTSAEDASSACSMRKVWKEIQGGREWIVDADLRDSFSCHRARSSRVPNGGDCIPEGNRSSALRIGYASLPGVVCP